MDETCNAFSFAHAHGEDHGGTGNLVACRTLGDFHADADLVGGRVHLEGLAMSGVTVERGQAARYRLVPSFCSGISTVSFLVPAGCTSVLFESAGATTDVMRVTDGEPCLLLQHEVLPFAPLEATLDITLLFRGDPPDPPPELDASMTCYFLPEKAEPVHVPPGLTLPLRRCDT